VNKTYVAILDKSYYDCIYVFYFYSKKEVLVPSGVLMYDSYNRHTNRCIDGNIWRGLVLKLTREAWLRQLKHDYNADDSTLTDIDTQNDVDKFLMVIELLK